MYCTVFMAGTAMMFAQFPSIGIIGGATTVGWGGPDIDMVTTDGVTYTLDNIVLTTGGLKFRQDDAWNDNNWGGNTWPSGNGIQNQGGVDVPCQAGIYDITFNYDTKYYEFVEQNLYPAISLIGSANEGVAETVDVDLFTSDGITYTGQNLHFVSGWLKFRKDYSWTTNWGNPAFPSGTGTQDGDNIVVPGTLVMNVTFNMNTGAYSFTVPSVALVGAATPWGWPTGAPGEVDGGAMASADGINYLLSNVTLTSGGAKFRQDNSWNVQWGGDGGFPSGTGSQGGTDIMVVAGTYDVTLNRTTGAYAFAVPAATTDFTKGAVVAYPNPASSAWTFSVANSTLTNVQIIDLTGKVVVNQPVNAQTATVNASALANGIYFAKVTAAEGVSTIRIVKN